MNKPTINSITRPSGASIDVYQWQAQGEERGVIQLLHGMAEHCLRYQPLADFLTSHGWHLVSHNHRGHGPKASQLGHVQLFAGESDAWDEMVNDAMAVTEYIAAHFSNIPLILLGHSMGSFMAQHCLMRASADSSPTNYSAVMLSGSTLPSQLQIKLLQPVIALEQWRLGLDKTSSLITHLSFGSFNKKIKGRRTAYDWLSRDEVEVDKYIQDPLCGAECSVGFWKSFSQGLLAIKPSEIKQVDQRLPLYIFSGSHDPVGEMDKGTVKLANMWVKHGNPVKLHLYPQARHELFNETNRLEVFNDVLSWLQARK